MQARAPSRTVMSGSGERPSSGAPWPTSSPSSSSSALAGTSTLQTCKVNAKQLVHFGRPDFHCLACSAQYFQYFTRTWRESRTCILNSVPVRFPHTPPQQNVHIMISMKTLNTGTASSSTTCTPTWDAIQCHYFFRYNCRPLFSFGKALEGSCLFISSSIFMPFGPIKAKTVTTPMVA